MCPSSKIFLFVAIFSVLYLKTVTCQTTEKANEATVSEENTTENLNDTVPQDLYVIKTVVYEVGILTDAANDTDNNTETHEQVDVSFFDPSTNGSVIDLSKIPIPIQTNVSGVTVTGLLPGADLASILLPPGDKPVPVLPKKQVIVTQNVSTTNPDKGSEIISNLPKLLGLTKKNSTETKEEKEEKEEKKEDEFDYLEK